MRQKGKDVKVSLRAKKYADVARVAASRKGGGHPRAAGYTEYDITVAEAERIAVQLAERSFKHAGRSSERIKTAGNELQ